MNDYSDNDYYALTDGALCKIIGGFIKHHRLIQNKTQSKVAEDADISRSTLSLLERGEKVTINTIIKVMRVLELLYVLDAFKVSQQISPIQLAKLEKKKRKRARGRGYEDETIYSDW
jgi:transcriptional regulator with XRE-family HTH domain